MSTDDAKYFGILLEEIRDQNKAVLEAVGDMQQKVAVLPEMNERIGHLEQDMKVVKAAIIDISKEQRDLDRRVTQVEASQNLT